MAPSFEAKDLIAWKTLKESLAGLAWRGLDALPPKQARVN